MYDLEGSDSGREWIEVCADNETDLSTWKFFEEGSNHGLTLYQGDVLSAQGCAVIVDDAGKFLEDMPSFSGTIYDSSWSTLKNTGETLTIRDADLNDVDTVSLLLLTI